jgi:uncharacterized protein YndB with AHSA1/START domain
MRQQSVIHNTFAIERRYPAKPESVFAAFADPAKKRRWFAEGDHHQVEDYEMDFREGGKECARLRLKNAPVEGILCTNDVTYYDIVPGHRIVFASAMTLGERRISVSLGTFEFLPSENGTDLIFTHQGAFFEGADGPEMREEGWRKLFDNLADEFPL